MKRWNTSSLVGAIDLLWRCRTT